jgi:hypothetical protein
MIAAETKRHETHVVPVGDVRGVGALHGQSGPRGNNRPAYLLNVFRFRYSVSTIKCSRTKLHCAIGENRVIRKRIYFPTASHTFLPISRREILTHDQRPCWYRDRNGCISRCCWDTAVVFCCQTQLYCFRTICVSPLFGTGGNGQKRPCCVCVLVCARFTRIARSQIGCCAVRLTSTKYSAGQSHHLSPSNTRLNAFD